MKSYPWIIFILLVVFSCKKRSEDNSDFIIFGQYYGFCEGDMCVKVYKLQNSELYMSINTTYPGDGPYSFVKLTHGQYIIAKHLINKIPSDIYTQSDTTWGMPDSHDQGGTLITIKRNSVIHKVRLDNDTMQIPVAYRSLSHDILQTIQDLN